MYAGLQIIICILHSYKGNNFFKHMPQIINKASVRIKLVLKKNKTNPHKLFN